MAPGKNVKSDRIHKSDKPSFLKDLLQRRVPQILGIYLGTSWAIVEFLDWLISRYSLTTAIPDIGLLILASFIPSVILLAYFHGKPGRDKWHRIETFAIPANVIISFLILLMVFKGNYPADDTSAIYSTGEIKNLSPIDDPRRVAVLYFETRGGDDDSELLSKGITESLIDELSSIKELFVISQNGSELYRNSDLKLEEIGKSLGVGIIVNGNINIVNDQIRIRISLVNAKSGNQFESQKFYYRRGELFQLIEDVTSTVSDYLRKQIGKEFSKVEVKTSTSVAKAWEYYYMAEELVGRIDNTGNNILNNGNILLSADSILTLAEEADPEWILPVIKRGMNSYKQSRLGGKTWEEISKWIDDGLLHSERALVIDPRNPDALELKATLLYWRYLNNLTDDPESDLSQAETLYKQAININPKQASALNSLSHLYQLKGWWAEAKNAAKSAYQLDPFLKNADVAVLRLITVSYDTGDSKEVKYWCEEGLNRFPLNYRFREGKILFYTMKDIKPDVKDAWTQFEKYAEYLPQDEKEYRYKYGLQLMGMVLARAELPDSARTVATMGRASGPENPNRELAYLESITRAWIGDLDESVRLFGIYTSANPGFAEGFREIYQQGDYEWLIESLFEALIDQPRFRALLGLDI